MTEYAKRDARALEPYYNRHVSAMTREKLDAKSDIAAELAWRDKLIGELTVRALWLKKKTADAASAMEDTQRLEWLFQKLSGDAIRFCVGELSDTSDGDEFRAAIDAAMGRERHG